MRLLPLLWLTWSNPFAELVPHFGRAIVELQQDTVDGFFLATESSERNKNAEFSEPVLMIQWT